jgi:hypothetical protein
MGHEFDVDINTDIDIGAKETSPAVLESQPSINKI